MIIEAVEGELVILSESVDEFMLLQKLSEKIDGCEIDAVQRCFSISSKCVECGRDRKEVKENQSESTTEDSLRNKESTVTVEFRI